jgi:hypothetical protein
MWNQGKSSLVTGGNRCPAWLVFKKTFSTYILNIWQSFSTTHPAFEGRDTWVLLVSFGAFCSGAGNDSPDG